MNLSKISIALLLATGLTACNTDKLDNDQNLYPETVAPILGQFTLEGNVVKGPLAFADVKVYELSYRSAGLQGRLVSEGRTDHTTAFHNINLNKLDGPFLVVVSSNGNTIDISTGKPPVITEFKTIITKENIATYDTDTPQPTYATPLSTLAVEVLASDISKFTFPTDTEFDNALKLAQEKVITVLGFGLDKNVDLFYTPPLLTPEANDDEALQSKIAMLRLANEAVAATAEAAGKLNSTKTNTAFKEIVADLAADNKLDGKAGDTTLASLENFYVKDNDNKYFLPVDVTQLIVPNTTTKVDDIESVLKSEANQLVTLINAEAISEEDKISLSLSENVDVVAQVPTTIDADYDNDGVFNDYDNCPNTSNIDQRNDNDNTLGAACDPQPIIDDIDLTLDEDTKATLTLPETDSNGDTITYTGYYTYTAIENQTELVDDEEVVVTELVDGEEVPVQIEVEKTDEQVFELVGPDTYEYTLPENIYGPLTIVYQATDGDNVVEANLNLTINSVNDPATGTLNYTGAGLESVKQELVIDETVFEDAVEGLADNIAEQAVYTWYIADDENGLNKTAVSTENSYTLVLADKGKYVWLEASFNDLEDNDEIISTQPTLVIGDPLVPTSIAIEVADTGLASVENAYTCQSYNLRIVPLNEAGSEITDADTVANFGFSWSSTDNTIATLDPTTDDADNTAMLSTLDQLGMLSVDASFTAPAPEGEGDTPIALTTTTNIQINTNYLCGSEVSQNETSNRIYKGGGESGNHKWDNSTNDGIGRTGKALHAWIYRNNYSVGIYGSSYNNIDLTKNAVYQAVIKDHDESNPDGIDLTGENWVVGVWVKITYETELDMRVFLGGNNKGSVTSSFVTVGTNDHQWQYIEFELPEFDSLFLDSVNTNYLFKIQTQLESLDGLGTSSQDIDILYDDFLMRKIN